VISAATVACHSNALTEFRAFLDARQCSIPFSRLVNAPALLDALTTAFGKHLFKIGAPIYIFRYTLTGLKQLDLRLHHQLPYGWQLLGRWEAVSPTVHRTPVPAAVFKAMISIALSWQLIDWSAISLLSYWAPARVGEPMSAVRADLTLPADTLLEGSHRILLRVMKPKTRGRGPRVQHTGFDRALECSFLSWAYGCLRPEEPLYARSNYLYRKTWDRILSVLGIPPGVYLPGGLRGGGAVSAYLHGKAIADIQRDMRLASQETLRWYLQEVAACNSLIHLSPRSRELIRVAACFYEAVLQATMAEAASSTAPRR